MTDEPEEIKLLKAQMSLPANLIKDVLEGSKTLARESAIRILSDRMIIKTWFEGRLAGHEAIIYLAAFETFPTIPEDLALEFAIFNDRLYSFVKGVEGSISLDIDLKRGTVIIKTLTNPLEKEMSLNLVGDLNYEWRNLKLINPTIIKMQSDRFYEIIRAFNNEGDKLIIDVDDQEMVLVNDSRSAELKLTLKAEDFLEEDYQVVKPVVDLILPMQHITPLTRFLKNQLTIELATYSPIRITHNLSYEGICKIVYAVSPQARVD